MFLLLIVELSGSGAVFIPNVTNLASTNAICRQHCWSATQDNETGIMYFGTDLGVLSYDGTHFILIPIQEKLPVRSVLATNGRIYVGSYCEFGFFEKDENGLLRYESLSSRLGNDMLKDEDFWCIVERGGDVYFSSFRNICRFDGDKVEMVSHDNQVPLYIFKYANNLYMQPMQGSFTALSNEMKPTGTYRNLPEGAKVVSVLDAGTEGFMVCTEVEGIWTIKEGNASRFRTTVDNDLADSHVNRAIKLKDGTILLGTIHNGLYAVDSNGNTLWHYNIDNGLGNNTVLGVFEDMKGNVWVMMDFGISLIHLSEPYTILKPVAGEPSIGTVYAINRIDDTIYIGTNQTLYNYSQTQGDLKGVFDVGTQIWHITPIEDVTFIGGNSMTYIIGRNGNVQKFDRNSTSLKRAVIHGQDVLVESSYYNLRIYRKDETGRWNFSNTVDGFGSIIRNIEVDNDGALWCAHMNSGVYRIELSPDLTKVESQMKFTVPGKGEKPLNKAFVMKIRGQVVVSNGYRLYQFNDSRNILEPLSNFESDLPSVKGVTGVTHIDNNTFWVASENEYDKVKFENGHYRLLLTIPLGQFAMQSNGDNNHVFVNRDDGTCYFALNNGIGRVMDNDTDNMTVPPFTLVSVESGTENGDIVQLPLADDTNPVIRGNISFKFGFPNFDHYPYKFSYKVEGRHREALITDEAEFRVVGLIPGDYVMNASVLDMEGNEVESIIYPFSVPPPIYATWWAILLYIISFVILAILIAKWSNRKVMKRKERKYQIEKNQRDLKIMEQEKIISEQQEQLLRAELASQGKQLASLAFDIQSKEKMIENLKKNLLEFSRKGRLESRELNELVRIINSDKLDKEVWDVFQQNFDLIHENFFRKLTALCPNLTSTDIKFCAMLRLNLSTKDIARLSNLSIRGVETARYRLRKKLNIPGKISIVQYLIDMK